jgi:GGDEF domain-containing protein
VNDSYGHVTGDELPRQFGAELRSVCRATDVIGRWGGDEFILLYDCGQAAHMAGEGKKELVARADAAMYEQKAASRVKVA